MVDITDPEDAAAVNIKSNIRNLPLTSVLLAGLAGAGVMAIASKFMTPKQR